MRYDVISFDLDGTLIDTAGEIAEAANRTLEEYGIARRPEPEIRRLIGNGLRELMLKLLAHVLLERPLRAAQLPTEQVLECVQRHYVELIGTSGRTYPGAAETIARLRRTGVHVACVTNKEHRLALAVLRAVDLHAAFDLVVGGDTLPQKKPDRAVLDHVVRHFGASADHAAHVGDSRTDMEAARNAGVAAWGVPWGYNAGDSIESALPDRIFASLPEVAGYVLAVNAGSCALAQRPSSSTLVRP